MKLLFDHNLSPRLVKRLADLYPDSTHVYLIGMDRVDDDIIWEYARNNGYAIVSKDVDHSDKWALIIVSATLARDIARQIARYYKQCRIKPLSGAVLGNLIRAGDRWPKR